jgi:hypothetical protein
MEYDQVFRLSGASPGNTFRGSLNAARDRGPKTQAAFKRTGIFPIDTRIGLPIPSTL